MARKKKSYTAEIWDKVAEHLKNLPEKPKKPREIDIQEGIARIKALIKEVQSKGYTVEEIAAEFAKMGITISQATIKSYMAPKKKAVAKTATAQP